MTSRSTRRPPQAKEKSPALLGEGYARGSGGGSRTRPSLRPHPDTVGSAPCSCVWRDLLNEKLRAFVAGVVSMGVAFGIIELVHGPAHGQARLPLVREAY